jgi:hypothetical protein
MVLAGLVFVGGAVGLEALGGWYVDRFGREEPGYGLLVTVEELLEMLGVAAFIYAVLRHLVAEHGWAEVRVSEPGSTRGERAEPLQG